MGRRDNDGMEEGILRVGRRDTEGMEVGRRNDDGMEVGRRGY